MAATGTPTPTHQTCPISSSSAAASLPQRSPPALVVLPVKPSPARGSHSRRASFFLLSSLAACSLSPTPPPASFAFSLAISGPKEWLKDQKKKTAKFILAPIEASRRSLQAAYSILTTNPSESAEKVEGGGDVRKLLSSAARDCVADDRSSIVAFQARTGVEVCTFGLLVKNAASLLDDRDPVKLETEARLDELVRSFSSLGSLVDSCDLQLPSDRQKVEAGLNETMFALDNFEQGIKNCLGV